MNKLYSIIVLMSIATAVTIHAMDPERHPLFESIDYFLRNNTLGTETNWTAILALLEEFVYKGNTFTVNEYFSPQGLTLLCLAAEDGKYWVVKKLLLQYKAKPNNYSPRSRLTPLMIACLQGEIEIVKLLLEFGADPYMKSAQGHDSFYFAEKYCQYNPVSNKTILKMLSDQAVTLRTYP
jgi:ankyrin repeat protein